MSCDKDFDCDGRGFGLLSHSVAAIRSIFRSQHATRSHLHLTWEGVGPIYTPAQHWWFVALSSDTPLADVVYGTADYLHDHPGPHGSGCFVSRAQPWHKVYDIALTVLITVGRVRARASLQRAVVEL